MHAKRLFVWTIAILGLLALAWAGSAVGAAPLGQMRAPARDGATGTTPSATPREDKYTYTVSGTGSTPAPTCTPGWSVVSSPNTNNSANSLQGVTVISANDIWAVGFYSNAERVPARTLTEHWDGTQ